MRAGVADRVRQQMALHNDIHSDGEFWKARDEPYYNSRVTGVEMLPLNPGEGTSILMHQQERHMPEFREFYEVYDQLGNIPRPGVVNPQPTHRAVITGPMQYKGQDFFFPVLGPGWLGHFLFNAYYPTEEEYVYAMAAMYQGEYEAVVEAGFILQIDDPGLADKFGMFYPPITVEEFRKHADLRIEATNWALSNIPEEQVRYHTCWGSWHTPHTTDIPFKHIVDLMLKVKAQAYSVEAADVRHALDYTVWEEVKFPDGKIYIPGVIAHKTTTIEPAELVAHRIVRYANIMGRENVIAGTDCGYGNRVYADIAWAKMQAMAAGAALATRQLWPRAS
jgi:5-methyltetrahydropteroyltriglutamate--homocysteine methyltransferase